MHATLSHDVMQVCRQGHVITDRLRRHPELARVLCHRCGSPTFSRCPSCGRDLPGALPQPGPIPIGEPRAPERCPSCAGAFPWTRQRPPRGPSTADTVETLLRRLPRLVRQLRDRPAGRATLRIDDVHDLQDLVRSILHLQYDDIYPESRTPSYSAVTRTDYVAGPDRVAVTTKLIEAGADTGAMRQQLDEDIAYHEHRGGCPCLCCFLYDPAQLLAKSEQLEAAWQRQDADMQVRCVIAW
jgi:hypothetical protein